MAISLPDRYSIPSKIITAARKKKALV